MLNKRDLDPKDNYIQSLHKILPAELTAIHFSLRAGAIDNTSLTPVFLGFSLLLAVIFFFVSKTLLGIDSKIQRFWYCATFVVWVVSVEASIIATDILVLNNQDRTYFLYSASSIAIIWSFLIPYLLLQSTKIKSKDNTE